MKQLNSFLFLLFIYCSDKAGAQPPGKAPAFILIKNINIVDVLNGKIIPKQDVVLKDSLVYFTGNKYPVTLPANATVIDGTEKYLCPGLWDMHFHLCWDKNNDTLLFPALLMNGITGIRDMGGDLKIMKDFKASTQPFRPVIFGAGPMIDGNPPVYADFSLPADSTTNMERVLDSLETNGADFFKTYSLIRESELRAVSSYCRQKKMQFAGHLSEYIEPETAISLGQKSIEHLNRLDELWRTDENRSKRLAGLMTAHNTFLCPTLITYQLKTRVRDSSVVNREYAPYISASLSAEWQAGWGKRLKRHTELADWEELNKTFRAQKELVLYFKKRGVLLLAGSDFAGMPYVYPGIGLQQELKLFVEAGLSNVEALRTATINPALFMSREKMQGSVTTGKFADLLILEKNPLENIENIKTIRSVLLKGKPFNLKK